MRTDPTLAPSPAEAAAQIRALVADWKAANPDRAHDPHLRLRHAAYGEIPHGAMREIPALAGLRAIALGQSRPTLQEA